MQIDWKLRYSIGTVDTGLEIRFNNHIILIYFDDLHLLLGQISIVSEISVSKTFNINMFLQLQFERGDMCSSSHAFGFLNTIKNKRFSIIACVGVLVCVCLHIITAYMRCQTHVLRYVWLTCCVLSGFAPRESIYVSACCHNLGLLCLSASHTSILLRVYLWPLSCGFRASAQTLYVWASASTSPF